MEKDLVLLKTLYIKAYNLYLEKEYKDSLKLLTHTSDLWIDYFQKTKFLMLMGMNYLKLLEYNKAERAFLEALAGSPENIKLLDYIGQVYFFQKRFVESEKAYFHARNIDDFNYTFTINMAKAAWKAGNIKRMFKRLKEDYIPGLLTKREEKKLKELLLDFLHDVDIKETFNIIKNFREWCFDKKKVSFNKVK